MFRRARRSWRAALLLLSAVVCVACEGDGGSDAPPRCGATLENVVEASEWVQATTEIRSYRYRASFDAFDTVVELRDANQATLAVLTVRQVFDDDVLADGTIEAVLQEGGEDSLRMTTFGLGVDDLGFEARAQLDDGSQSLDVWAELDNELCFAPGDPAVAPPCADGLPLGDPAYTMPTCGLLYDTVLTSGSAPTLRRLTYVADAPSPPSIGQAIIAPEGTRYSLAVVDSTGVTPTDDVLAWAEAVGVDGILGSRSEALLTAAYLDRAWWRARDKQVAFCIGEEIGVSTQALSSEQSTDAKLVDWINGTDRTKKQKNVWGDPHLVSLDGRGWDFQAQGEFVLAEGVEDDFVIQIRTESLRDAPFSTCARVSFATAVATEIDGTRIVLYTRSGLETEVDGVVVEDPTMLPALPSGASLRLERDRVTLGFPGGEVLEVVGSATYMNVAVTVPKEGSGRVRGLLGNFDGDDTNDIALRDGTVLPAPVAFADKHGVLADSWRISQADSLFDYEPGEDTETFTRRNFPTQAARIEDLPSTQRGEAEQACREEGVSDPSSLLDCVLDTVCFQSSAIADQHSKQTTGGSVESADGELLFRGAVAAAVVPEVIESREALAPDTCEAPRDPIIEVFDEQPAVTLEADLQPDLSPDGGAIAAGTTVRSVLLHRNPTEAGGATLSGSVVFGGPLVGLITSASGLSATDATLGASGTDYVDEDNRGLEAEDGIVPSWSGRSITVDWGGLGDADQVRALVEVTP